MAKISRRNFSKLYYNISDTPDMPYFWLCVIKQLKYSENQLKTAEKCEKSPNSPKYRAHGFPNRFIRSPVLINPIVEKRISMLSPIGKKLVWPYQALGGHLGFWPPGPPGSTFFRGNIIYFQEYTSKKSSTSKKFSLGGGALIPFLHAGLIELYSLK